MLSRVLLAACALQTVNAGVMPKTTFADTEPQHALGVLFDVERCIAATWALEVSEGAGWSFNYFARRERWQSLGTLAGGSKAGSAFRAHASKLATQGSPEESVGHGSR